MEFELVRASSAVTATLASIAALIGAVALLLVWLAWTAGQSSIRIDHGALELRVPLYGRSIPLAELDLDRAAIVDLSAESPLRPSIRTNGIGLPGYGVGWFRLRNGNKALLAVTTRKDVL